MKTLPAAILALTVIATPVLAQQTTTNPGTTTQQTAPRADSDDDNDFDLGWLGLIGLAGLAGLLGRKRHPDPVVTSTTPGATTTTRR